MSWRLCAQHFPVVALSRLQLVSMHLPEAFSNCVADALPQNLLASMHEGHAGKQCVRMNTNFFELTISCDCLEPIRACSQAVAPSHHAACYLHLPSRLFRRREIRASDHMRTHAAPCRTGQACFTAQITPTATSLTRAEKNQNNLPLSSKRAQQRICLGSGSRASV